MRPIGFSTGAIAKGDFTLGLRLQTEIAEVTAVELSALRDHELEPLLEAIGDLPLDNFEYVSFHAPSKLSSHSEERTVDLLLRLPPQWPIIVHPDLIQMPSAWDALNDRLCLENMDSRKPTGRTVDELRAFFARFPKATFCLDVGHARQMDPTMTTALLMLREFAPRLRQVHVSDVGPAGEHLPVGVMARVAFGRLAAHIPPECPLIVESVIAAGTSLRSELHMVRSAFERPIGMDTLGYQAGAACLVT